MAISGNVYTTEDGETDVAPSGLDSSESVVRSRKMRSPGMSAYDKRVLRAKAILDLQKCEWSHGEIVAALGWSRRTIYSSRMLVAAIGKTKDAK